MYDISNSPFEKHHIIKLYRGCSNPRAQIEIFTQMLCISAEEVVSYLKSIGLFVPDGILEDRNKQQYKDTKAYLSVRDRAELTRLYNEGWTRASIAKKLHCRPSAVDRAIIKEGLALRKDK